MRLSEAGARGAEPFERFVGEDDGDGLSAAGQLDRLSSLRLDQNGGQLGASFRDGVATGHDRSPSSFLTRPAHSLFDILQLSMLEWAPSSSDGCQ